MRGTGTNLHLSLQVWHLVAHQTTLVRGKLPLPPYEIRFTVKRILKIKEVHGFVDFLYFVIRYSFILSRKNWAFLTCSATSSFEMMKKSS